MRSVSLSYCTELDASSSVPHPPRLAEKSSVSKDFLSLTGIAVSVGRGKGVSVAAGGIGVSVGAGVAEALANSAKFFPPKAKTPTPATASNRHTTATQPTA